MKNHLEKVCVRRFAEEALQKSKLGV